MRDQKEIRNESLNIMSFFFIQNGNIHILINNKEKQNKIPYISHPLNDSKSQDSRFI